MKELIQLTYYSLFECNFYKLPSTFPLKHFCNYLPITLTFITSCPFSVNLLQSLWRSNLWVIYNFSFGKLFWYLFTDNTDLCYILPFWFGDYFLLTWMNTLLRWLPLRSLNIYLKYFDKVQEMNYYSQMYKFFRVVER